MREGINFTVRGAAIVLFGVAGLASAFVPIEGPLPTPNQPYVKVSVITQLVDLGSVPKPGLYDCPATLTLHIEANCPHGGVFANATPLVLSNGGCIPTERIFVRIPKTGEYVSLRDPVDITGPMGPGVFDFELKFRTETVIFDLAGRYTGTFVFTCMGDGP